MTAAQSFDCLDLLPVRWLGTEGQEQEDFAILGQVWATGGVIQLDQPVTVGTRVVISLPNAEVATQVQACSTDEFGAYIELCVEPGCAWLGTQFQPAFQLSEQASSAETVSASLPPLAALKAA